MYTFKFIYWKSDSIRHTQLQNSHVHQNKPVCEWAVEDDFHFSLACNRGHFFFFFKCSRYCYSKRILFKNDIQDK